MDVKFSGTVVDSVKGDKDTFVTFADGETGGLLKLMFKGLQEFKPAAPVKFEAIVKPNLGRTGLYLQVVQLKQ